jgi:hypothetical protein
MAIQNGFNNYIGQINSQPLPQRVSKETHGIKLAHLQQTLSILNGDSATSTYILFKAVPSEAKFKLLEIETDAFAGCTISIGLYDSDTGALVSTAGALANALSIASAANKQVPLDGLTALTHDNTDKTLYEIAGETLAKKRGTYDVVLLLNNTTAAAGKITARGELVPAG